MMNPATGSLPLQAEVLYFEWGCKIRHCLRNQLENGIRNRLEFIPMFGFSKEESPLYHYNCWRWKHILTVSTAFQVSNYFFWTALKTKSGKIVAYMKFSLQRV